MDLETKNKLEGLREKQGKIDKEQKDILEKADSEKRNLTAEEEQQYDKLDNDFNTVSESIKEILVVEEREKTNAERRKKHQEREEERNRLKGRQTATELEGKDKKKEDKDKREANKYAEYRIRDKFVGLQERFRQMHIEERCGIPFLNAAVRYLRYGPNALNEVDRSLFAMINAEYGSEESRAVQADLDTVGGYLIAPEQMVMQIIEELDNLFFVRRYANVISMPKAASLGAPARDTDVGDLTWTAEIATGAEDSSLAFGKRDLFPHPLARRIKVSRKLIRLSLIDIVAYISKRFAFKHGAVQENAFLNGSGVNQPLGIYTASDAGIPASRDVSTGNTQTAITADGLIECKYSFPSQYRMLPSMRWCFHRDAIKMIRKLKDGEGQYLWKQGLSDRPDTILEIPFDESEYAPNTFTTGRYVGSLQAWEYYWIADALNYEIQMLGELYAETNQIGYICRSESDGQPVQDAAFRRVKLA